MPENSLELKEIKEKLVEIDEKLQRVLELQLMVNRSPVVSSSISSLSQHLKKTATTIAAMGEATAEQVSTRTGRTRAAESDYLNQLASRGFLRKERKGKEVFFRIFTLYMKCPNCRANVLMTLEKCAICGAALSKEEAGDTGQYTD